MNCINCICFFRFFLFFCFSKFLSSKNFLLPGNYSLGDDSFICKSIEVEKGKYKEASRRKRLKDNNDRKCFFCFKNASSSLHQFTTAKLLYLSETYEWMEKILWLSQFLELWLLFFCDIISSLTKRLCDFFNIKFSHFIKIWGFHQSFHRKYPSKNNNNHFRKQNKRSKLPS